MAKPVGFPNSLIMDNATYYATQLIGARKVPTIWPYPFYFNSPFHPNNLNNGITVFLQLKTLTMADFGIVEGKPYIVWYDDPLAGNHLILIRLCKMGKKLFMLPQLTSICESG